MRAGGVLAIRGAMVALAFGMSLAWGAAAPQDPGAESTPPPAGQTSQAPAAKRPVRYFKVYADNWQWDPDTIKVKEGTHVVLKLHAFRATRSFELKAYKLNVSMPQDQDVTVEFDADRKGKFPWKCGRPCGDGCAKMRGTFVVD